MTVRGRLAVCLLALCAAACLVAAPASAAPKLCKFKEAACVPGGTYPAGTPLWGFAKETTFMLEPTIEGEVIKVTIACGSEFEGETLFKEGVPVRLELFNFAGCVAGGSECTVTTVNLPEGLIKNPVNGNGKLELEVNFDVTCAELTLKCRYGGFPLLDVVAFGANFIAPENVNLNKQMRAGEENCPAGTKWWGTYEMFQPGLFYVTN